MDASNNAFQELTNLEYSSLRKPNKIIKFFWHSLLCTWTTYAMKHPYFVWEFDDYF